MVKQSDGAIGGVSLRHVISIRNVLSNALEPIASWARPMMRVFRLGQLMNASSSIWLIVDGIVTVAGPDSLKAAFPICVTQLGIIKLLSDLHPIKELSLMEVMTLLNVTSMSLLHLLKADTPIVLTESGIMILLMDDP